jgi:hypothetical protein
MPKYIRMIDSIKLRALMAFAGKKKAAAAGEQDPVVELRPGLHRSSL